MKIFRVSLKTQVSSSYFMITPAFTQPYFGVANLIGHAEHSTSVLYTVLAGTGCCAGACMCAADISVQRWPLSHCCNLDCRDIIALH